MKSSISAGKSCIWDRAGVLRREDLQLTYSSLHDMKRAEHIGEMTEWLKVHAWKVCIPQKGIASSNLAFSAKILTSER